MKPFIQIALPSGHVYQIETSVIAELRAKVMLSLHADEFPTIAEALADTVEYFDDDYSVCDWATSNMKPEDYMPSARLVRFTPPEADYANADWTLREHAAPVAELSGDEILRHPVESVFSVMAASGQLCNVTVLNMPDGKPYAAMVLIIGNEAVVGSYINALQITGELITGSAAANPVH